jgi:hypothetical protein
VQAAEHALEIVAKQLHPDMSVTAGTFARHIGRDVAGRMAASRFVARLYFVVLTLLFRLHQSTFSQEQVIAMLSAKSVDFANNNVFAYRGRQLALAVILLAACASEKLALAPPAGVDFSGSWKLNKADSDDPQRLLQNQSEPGHAKASSGGSTGGGPGGGSPGGGRGGKRGGRSGGGTGEAGAQAPPTSATLQALGSSLHWPGKDLQIKQVGGTVEITSENMTRIYRPSTVNRHNHTSADSEGAQRRDGPPPLCGWSAKTLVVLVGDSEDVRLRVEQHYGISEDGQRLVEVVGVKGHMDGFTMSRVWDRAP